ncbi:uncharacterized protein BYT42DRAFT_582631 [Radiomyces spectabilis]|uniref:uncharacterized protein n=1 Tax=Radiomyces spectabilis TaxID=64574 RepID=UPI002220E760|nr:uncharacterized protein BYT42DRAFT_582631 [Radiomyces spectabilis]KAI8370501.1 hypothetical protein BYT42DRAFT_582631 [Radiomyces spectabilis]
MLQSAIKSKAKGNISSVFAHLGASRPTLGPRFIDLKKSIAPKDPAVLQRAFDRLLNHLKKEAIEIRQRGSSVIPETDIKTIRANGGQLPESVAKEVKKRGAVVVRNIVDQALAVEYKDQIQKYIQRHPGIVGYPEDHPQAWEIYWATSQVAARSHPNFTATAVALNQLWHTHGNAPIDLTRNLIYCDRLRIRQPGDAKFALGGHIDGGSIERWEDPEYRQCYKKILQGQWEDYDPFDVTHRIEAEMDFYESPSGCSMFRIFQGWLALSKIEPNGGTLRVCPLIREQTAYFMMKPLLKEYLDKNDFMGAWPGRCQEITAEHHPHITDIMVSVSPVEPGDGVFWHCDLAHAVEPKNEMKSDSSVLYIPSTPICRRNSEYLRRQRDAFSLGLTPPDFPGNHCEKDFEDRAMPDHLTQAGKMGMGFAPFDEENDSLNSGQKQARRQHNQILGLTGS